MKRVVYRVLAYILDLSFVSIFLFGLSNLNIFDLNKNMLNIKYERFYSSNDQYQKLIDSIDKYFDDGRITENEYNDIIKNYPDYFTVFNQVTFDEDLKIKDIEKIKKDIDTLKKENNTNYSYEIEKLNTKSTIVGIIAYLLYFGLLQYILKGQTVFKKIFRLRVVDIDNNKKKIPLWKYIIRSILVCEILITVTNIILLAILSKGNYIIANHWLVYIKYIYELLFIIVLVIRDDNRSIHDLLLNTEVVRFDKEGNKINEVLFNSLDSDDNEKNSHKNNRIVSKNSH